MCCGAAPGEDDGRKYRNGEELNDLWEENGDIATATEELEQKWTERDRVGWRKMQGN